MKNELRLIGLFLCAAAMFGQHGGGARGGMATGLAHSPGHINAPAAAHRIAVSSGNRSRANRWFGGGVVGPYYQLGGNYVGELPDTSYYPQDYVLTPPNNLQPGALSMANRPANSVINEYNWKSEGSPSPGNSATFTVALKDGSTRIAVATWLQNGKLFYIDSRGRGDALSPGLIDRETTIRLNRERNLIIQLPPG